MAEPVPSVAPAQTTVLEPPIIQPYNYKPCCNPCPCMPLDRGVRSIAIFEILLNTFYVIGVFVVGIITVVDMKTSQFDGILVAYLIIIFFIVLACLILGIFLHFGAIQGSLWKCCIYFIGRSISEIILIIFLTAYATEEAINKKPLTSKEYSNIAFLLIIILVGMYLLFVVYFFMEQLKFNPSRPIPPDQQSQPGVVRPLPNDDGVAPASGGQ